MAESQKWFVLVGLSVSGLLLYLLAPVLTPFLIAAALAYIGDPLVDWLERRRFSRTLAVITVFLALTLIALILLLILVPMLERQIALLMSKLPQYLDWLQNKGLPALTAYLGVEISGFNLADLKQAIREQWIESGGAVKGVLGAISRSGMTLLAWLANLVLIPVVAFYMLRDWDIMVERVHELIPRRYEATVVRLAKASDEVLIQKVGIEAFVAKVSKSNPVLYGICAVVIALGTGLLVGFFFKGGAH